MDKVTDVVETCPRICSSSYAQSAAHCFLNSTSLLLDEQEMRPAMDVASEYPESLQFLGAHSFV